MHSALIALLAIPLLGAGGVRGNMVPLQDASCDLPKELSSVTGHALFRYIVSPDGSVGDVVEVYLTSVPPSRKDAFSQALRSCLEGWHYKPAQYSGIPVPVQMLMAFHYFEPTFHGAPLVDLPDGKTIPLRHFEIMREEKLNLARRLLDGPEYAEISRGGWTLRTNVRSDQREELLSAIDRTQRRFGSVFPNALSVPNSSPLVVLLFRNEDQFNQVAAFDNVLRMKGFIAGQYSPQEHTAYASLGDQPIPMVVSTLVHETAHHLIHQRLIKEPRYPPFWVNEGLATFMELLCAEESSALSCFARGEQRDGAYRWRARGTVYLNAVGNKRPDLRAFLAGSSEVGSIPADVAYGLSWLLVHFMINGENGIHRERLDKWLLTDADGHHGESILAALGLTAEELDIRLQKHRKKLLKAAY